MCFTPCVLSSIMSNVSGSGEFVNVCVDISVFWQWISTPLPNTPLFQDANGRPHLT